MRSLPKLFLFAIVIYRASAAATGVRTEAVNLDGSVTVHTEFPPSDFQAMTPEQGAQLAVFKLDQVNDAVRNMNQGLAAEACPGPQVAVIRDGQRQTVAICMLSDEEQKTLRKNAGKKNVSWEFITGNDANPAMIGKRVYNGKDTDPRLSDDVGRTFDIGLKRRSTSDDGFSEVRFNSTSFGQRTPVNGRGRSPTDKPYMKLFNVTSIAIENGEKLPGEDFGVDNFRINESSIEVSTGRGKSLFGTELQTWFHKETKSGPEYEYVEAGKTKYRGVLKTGFQRVIEGDLAGFHCKVMATGLVGIGTDGKPLLEGRLGATINTGSLGGGSSANPWIQLDGYRKHLVRSGGAPETETTVRISTSANILGANIKPFIGVSRYDGPLDRKYGAGSRGGINEAYYSVGVMVEWK